MNFEANGKSYVLDPQLRDTIKPHWQEIFRPSDTKYPPQSPYLGMPLITFTEERLSKHNISLVGKDILEVGCCYGQRSYLMAKYEGTKVHGIDVDEYLVNQTPDLNIWNSKDVEFIHNKVDKIRKETSASFPESVSKKVTFETCGMESYVTPNPHDMIISFDVIEHILDLPTAFNQMYNALKTGGIAYHEYNSFFSLNGGHSLCTLDFIYGHCRLSAKDFERYIREVRPDEEKTALNFYHSCLNRITQKELLELAEKSGFEVIEFSHKSGYNITDETKERLKNDVLPDIQIHYPNCELEDLLQDEAQLILRRK